MAFNDILQIGYYAIAFIVGLIPSIISFISAAKAKKKAKNAIDAEAAEKDMAEHAEVLIKAAEDFYKVLDVALKANGESSGPYKKESVMNKLQTYASEKGYEFNAEYWSEKINNIVALTKSVNAK